MFDSEPNPLEGHHSASTSRDQQLPMKDDSTHQTRPLARLSREQIVKHNKAVLKQNPAALKEYEFVMAKKHTSMCWGKNLEDLWKNEKDMGVLYNMLDFKKKNLIAATNLLCRNLKPANILLSMKAKGALTQDDVTEIKTHKTNTDQVDKLIEVMILKPVSTYNTFMDILQEERPDLHSNIKSIEKTQALKRKLYEDPEEKISYIVPLFHDTFTLSDEDIEDIVNILKPNELKRLIKELNLTSAEKEEAIKENLDPKEEARFYLGYWREINGREATRQKILDALKACRLMYKVKVFEDKWGASYAGTGMNNLASSSSYARDDST